MFISALISRCSCGKSLSSVGTTTFLQGLGLLEQRRIPTGVNDILKQKVLSNHRNTEYMEKARHTRPFPVTVKEMTTGGRGSLPVDLLLKALHLPTVHLNLKQSGACGQGLSSTHWLGVHHACHQGPAAGWVKVLLKERYCCRHSTEVLLS